MNIKNLFTDDDAVSPVIGVILMVAITVILAAVIGAFVLDLGSGQEKTPTASYDFEFDGTDEVTITHETGDEITGDATLEIVVEGNSLEWDSATLGGSYPVSAGNQVSGAKSDFGSLSGNWQNEEVRVVWTSETGDTSSTLAQATAPDNT
jgi:flagellin-like protein